MKKKEGEKKKQRREEKNGDGGREREERMGGVGVEEVLSQASLAFQPALNSLRPLGRLAP